MPIENTEATFKLQDRTAVLVGSATPVNIAIASKFTQLGANVAMVDRNIDALQRFASQIMDMREINERYGRAFAIQADFSKPHGAQDAISRSAEAFGGIDIFIDGSVTTLAGAFREPKALEDLEQSLDLNLRAPVQLTHAVLRFLEGRKRGRIIYLQHDLAQEGMINNSIAALTRSGLSAFAKSLSRELADKNITINCVAMGASEDFLLAQHRGESKSIQEAQQILNKQYPFATLTEPERVANMVAFLASPLGIGISGQTLSVNR